MPFYGRFFYRGLIARADTVFEMGVSERDAGACVICLESEPAPIQSGCACRADMGLAHVRCRVLAAEARSDTYVLGCVLGLQTAFHR